MKGRIIETLYAARCIRLHQSPSATHCGSAVQLTGTVFLLLLLLRGRTAFYLIYAGREPDKNYPRTTTTFQLTHTKPRGNVLRCRVATRMRMRSVACMQMPVRNNYSFTPRQCRSVFDRASIKSRRRGEEKGKGMHRFMIIALQSVPFVAPQFAFM